MATIVITGAAGNIGGKIKDGLLSRGQKIRCIVKNVVELDELAGKGTEIADGSFEDAALPTKAFSGADAVFANDPTKLYGLEFQGVSKQYRSIHCGSHREIWSEIHRQS